MNNVRDIQALNERELEAGLAGGGHSWHDDYKGSAYVFVGGLDFGLTEGDLICVLSQYGELVDCNLARDEDSGKSKGFAFACYEDQRSTVLAVDNLNGATVAGRTLRVDHVDKYKAPKRKKTDAVAAVEENPNEIPLGQEGGGDFEGAAAKAADADPLSVSDPVRAWMQPDYRPKDDPFFKAKAGEEKKKRKKASKHKSSKSSHHKKSSHSKSKHTKHKKSSKAVKDVDGNSYDFV